MGNLPFDVEETEIERFFHGLKVQFQEQYVRDIGGFLKYQSFIGIKKYATSPSGLEINLVSRLTKQMFFVCFCFFFV